MPAARDATRAALRRPARPRAAPVAPGRAAARHALLVVLAAWGLSRVVVGLAALAGSALLGAPERGVARDVPDALALVGGWDTVWYLEIAARGYTADPGAVGDVYTDLAFFPLVPVIAAAAGVLGLNPFLAALAVSNLAFLAALAGLHALVAGRAGRVAADRAVWVLALLPASYAASLAYGEGLVLALAVLSALAAARGRWLLAAVLAAPAPLARATGLLVPLLAALRARPAVGTVRALAVTLPGLAALAAFLGWLWVTRGSPLLPFRAQQAWEGRPVVGFVTAAPEWAGGLRDLVTLRTTGAAAGAARDIAFGALYVALLVRLWRRDGGLRSPWVVYSLLCVAIPLSTFGPTAIARYGLLAFPLAWTLAEWIAEHPRLRRPLLVAAPVVTVLLVACLRVRSP